MTSKNNKPHNIVKSTEPKWEKVPGLNAPPIDSKLLK